MKSPAASVGDPNPLPARGGDPSAELPGEDEQRGAGSEAAYARLLARLSQQSVVKRFEAYVDVPWEDPAFALDPEDPRFELPDFEPLGSTSWYRALPAATRARLGAHLFVSFMKIGAQFENALQRGLLEYALELPNRAPEFRYAYHELIEEAHHSLMFQEFVNRSGLAAPGLPPLMRIGARRIVRLARRFPELFFFFVLGGEDPIDYVQRTALRDRQMRHPLLQRISQIHVTEEARHLSFARAFLERNVPRLPRRKRLHLRIAVPLLLRRMAGLMLQASPSVVRTYAIPRAVLDEAYHHNPVQQRRAAEALRKVRDLCVELGLATPPFDRLWKRLGIWA
jgi:hypothetical protein